MIQKNKSYRTHKFLAFIFIISFLQGCSSGGPDSAKYPSIPKEIGQDFCALDGRQYGHTVVVIDKTSTLNQGQLDFISSHVFGEKFYGTYQPFTKFSYLLIDSSKPTSQKYIWSACRPKKGSATKYSLKNNNNDDLNSRDETSVFVEKEWQNFMSDSFIIRGRHLKPKNQTSNNSLIFETIMEVLNRPGLDFGSDYPVRNLVIVSDLMQSSRRLSFYAECKSNKHVSDPDICPKLNTILKKNLVTKEYIDAITPKKEVGDINIKIVYVNNRYETKASLDETLLALWSEYFSEYGFKAPEIIRMVDLN